MNLKKTTIVSLVITAFFLSCSNPDKERVKSTLLMGIAEVNYTPEVGLAMAGNYRGDDYASRGVHDSLYAKAFVAKDDKGEKVALLTVDICFIPKESIEMMRTHIASKTTIKAANIMIMSTHTHSGPVGGLNAPKAIEYLTKAASAVIEADEKLKPTILSVGRSTENRISHNRRLKCLDGTTHMCWEKFEPGFVIEPWGPIDPEVITLSLAQAGKPTGVIVNFACHATTLTGNNWLYTADYPGYMVEAIRKVKGKDYVPMFFNGACGNVTQVDYRIGFPDTYQECQRIGYLLGVSALEAITSEVPVSTDIIAVSREMVPLKHLTITDEQFAWAQAVIKKVERDGMPPAQADGIPDAQYAKDWVQMRAIQDQVDSLEVMVVRIGDTAFVGLPGEMFTEFGIDIKAKSPCKNTMVMGLTNDEKGYFPTAVSFTQGPKGFTPMITGYETTPGTTNYEIGSGEKLAESAIIQLNKLF
ncbi:MAG: neutral/alkaline non-lysosomal ceramidase N-terminal domain-containing protein [Bacteroidia bacterium]|nr:neutral/alkaline non-lysosomal ceramidase N-terminal domain-containing protein [Bacteroidia bacterium]